MPEKRCATCGKHYTWLWFINRFERRMLKTKTGKFEYGFMVGTDSCFSCIGQEDFALVYSKDGKLRMRLSNVRDERGEPFRLFDDRLRQWTAIEERGIRMMDKRRPKDPDVLRLQPRKDRSHDRDGETYGSEERLDLSTRE